MSETQNPNDKNMLTDTAIAFWESRFLSFEFVSNFDIRISDFPILSLHIPNRGKTHYGLADSREFSCGDHFINVLVSRPGFLGEACP
jgi:hypothetical protein